MLRRSIPDRHTRPAARIVGTGDRAVALRGESTRAPACIGAACTGAVSASASACTQDLNYDRLDRLQEVRDSNLALIEAYTYDATGNRLSQQLGTQAATSYSYPSTSRRLSAVGAAARGYDAVGNTLTGVPGYEADSASYDARNRLVQVGSPSAQLLANYNGRGERVLASQGAPAPALPTTSAAWTTSAGVRGYVYDESGQVLSTLIAGNPLRHEEIVWIDNLPVGRVLSSTSAVLEVHAIHSDHLNTPRALANAQAQGGQAAGTVVWRWKLNSVSATGSNAFGAQPADENPDGNGTTLRFDLRFPGQQWDAAVGVSYNYFRDYEPQTGRYVESDPIGLKGGVSTYGYSLAQPLRLIDEKGLQSYVCTRDARGLPGVQHQFSCTTTPSGEPICAGQAPACGPLMAVVGCPGTDSGETFNPSQCRQIAPPNTCFQDCLIREYNAKRPNYAWPNRPFFSDCFEWVEDIWFKCSVECYNFPNG